jgi:hypothetical protein
MKPNKYQNKLCDNKMSFEDCELTILRNAVDTNELETKKKIVNNPEISKIIKILESFLRKKKLVCYGGTAINNILPIKSQFYDKSSEIPDYDFYSSNALDDSKELADIYYKAGYIEVEAKAGVHFGTYKVFVNYIPIADITYLHNTIFDSIKKESIVVDGIMYAPPNFLRMNMYLELSRPNGDVSRWEKVFKRLNLLNSSYPLSNINCSQVQILRQIQSQERETIQNSIRDSVIKESAVFFGGFAVYLYSRYMPNTDKSILNKNPDFDILATDARKVTNKIVIDLKKNGVQKIEVIEHEEIGEIIPLHFEIRVNDNSVAFVYKTMACHSYNTLNIKRSSKKNSQIKVNVATIDTMISFYLAFYYSDKSYYHQDRILCMTKLLFEVEQKNRLSQEGLLQRFTQSCYGTQETLGDIRIHKTNKFKELSNKTKTREYEEWFLKYNPNAKKTIKKNESKQNVTKRRKSFSQKSVSFIDTLRTKGILI